MSKISNYLKDEHVKIIEHLLNIYDADKFEHSIDDAVTEFNDWHDGKSWKPLADTADRLYMLTEISDCLKEMKEQLLKQ